MIAYEPHEEKEKKHLSTEFIDLKQKICPQKHLRTDSREHGIRGISGTTGQVITRMALLRTQQHQLTPRCPNPLSLMIDSDVLEKPGPKGFLFPIRSQVESQKEIKKLVTYTARFRLKFFSYNLKHLQVSFLAAPRVTGKRSSKPPFTR